MTSLFDLLEPAEGLARNDHPDTAQAAAKAIAPHSGTLRARVLDALGAAPGGLAADQIERTLSLSGNTVRPRLVELRKAGLAEQSDRTAKTRSGREARLWVITDAGRAALAQIRSDT